MKKFPQEEQEDTKAISLRYFETVTEDFRTLTEELDRELRKENGELQLAYVKYNQLDAIKDIVVAYSNGEPVGCGSMKEYEPGVYELKRIYVRDTFRKMGIARELISLLEEIAKKKNVTELILETGDVLIPAMRLYSSLGYERMENYGQYREMKASVCMKKSL